MADLSFLGNIFNPSSSTATSQPTGTNVYQTNIPEYAQPYVQNMMNATQAQIFQTDASGNVTGFNQYQPYSGMDQTAYNNASQAVAGFSPLQQQAQSAAANLQMPGQYGAATNLATASGLGALGTTGQAGMYGGMGNMAGQQAAGMSNAYGGLGAMAGQQGANIGQSLGQMSTNPNAVGAYMNPYIQNALNPALQLSNQQYGMMGQQEQANATKAGAFGGTREALMAGLNQQNQMLANNQLIGNAYNTAYGQAQQQMNAANQAALSGNAQALQGYGMGLQGAGQAGQLGIQGAQTGLQGVGAQQAGYGQAGQAGANLANIGGQQLGAQQNIINTQAAQGAAQQANAQQIINQGIQNYATAQQYPLMQLGTMSNMLHGLPMQAATTQQYQAAPSALNQAVGVAGVAGSLAGARGGLPSEFKKGIKGYAVGGVIGGTQADLESMPTEALQKEMGVTQSPTIKDQIKQILQARAGSQYAGGGIIAFSEGSEKTVGDDAKKEIVNSAFSPENAGITSQILPGLAGAQQTPAGITAVNQPPAPAPAPAPVSTPAQPPAQTTAAPGAITNATPKPNIPAIVAKTSYDKTMEVGNNPNIPGFLEPPSEELKDQLFNAHRQKLEAYLGPDDSEAQMAKLDKRMDRETKMFDKNQKLIYASMFAKIGSTPGSLIQATLAGIQNAVPQIIGNDEKRNEALNAIDDAKTAVNKAKRAEALQKWDVAHKYTSEAVKNIMEANKLKVENDKTEKEIAGRKDVAITQGEYRLREQKLQNEGTIGAASLKLQNVAQEKLEGDYLKSIDKYNTAKKEFDENLNKTDEGMAYTRAQRRLSDPSYATKDPKGYEAAKNTVNRIDNQRKEALEDRIADVQYYDQRRKREGATIENPNVSTQSTNKKDRRPLSDFQK